MTKVDIENGDVKDTAEAQAEETAKEEAENTSPENEGKIQMSPKKLQRKMRLRMRVRGTSDSWLISRTTRREWKKKRKIFTHTPTRSS